MEPLFITHKLTGPLWLIHMQSLHNAPRLSLVPGPNNFDTDTVAASFFSCPSHPCLIWQWSVIACRRGGLDFPRQVAHAALLSLSTYLHLCTMMTTFNLNLMTLRTFPKDSPTISAPDQESSHTPTSFFQDAAQHCHQPCSWKLGNVAAPPRCR